MNDRVEFKPKYRVTAVSAAKTGCSYVKEKSKSKVAMEVDSEAFKMVPKY